MAIYRQAFRAVRLITISLAIALTLLSTPAWANNLPQGLAAEQPAILIGPKAGNPVPLYLRPAANQPNVGYGINGSTVTVMEQVASFLPEADQDSAWNHIRLNDPPFTEGWVQGRFLKLKEVDSSITD